ncbi:MAG: MBL fold metallo-hydrolase [Chloroflexi bacterium]|nr:MBL fold metallo-hydrolase [Chloroflexota bacterium]
MSTQDAVRRADSENALGLRVHLLDVGKAPNGDAVLCQFGDRTVLIDGGHPDDADPRPPYRSIPEQLGDILNAGPPFNIDLLVVTHAHSDHIGCLPRLVPDQLRIRWALLADPQYRWGSGTAGRDLLARRLAAVLSEEPYGEDMDDQELSRFAEQAERLQDEYHTMIDNLRAHQTNVVLYGTADHSTLVAAFRSIGLEIIGPTREQLRLCQEQLQSSLRQALAEFEPQLPFSSAASLYRAANGATGTQGDGPDDVWAQSPRNAPSNFVNLESITLAFEYDRRKLLFAGDMQFADPNVDVPGIRWGVRGLRREIGRRAPYDFVKISHHGSYNALNAQVLAELMGSNLFGVCAGSRDPGHPHPRVLRLLNDHRGVVRWVRTDRNGLSSIFFGAGRPAITVARGRINDARPNATAFEVQAEPLPTTGRVRITLTV